jgi:hypothetical protein
MIPNAVVGGRIDAVTATVQDQRDQGLGYP